MSAALTHRERVAAHFTPGSVEHRVALYHDHIEDGLGEVPEDIRDHVVTLTREPDEEYRAYIDRIWASKDFVAIRVKLADLLDNRARCRGEHGGTVNPGLEDRYDHALAALAGWKP